jgi:PAS domain S-box-containing protein
MLQYAHDNPAPAREPESTPDAQRDTEAAVRSLATVLVETASDAIVLADCRGAIMSWNRAAQRLFGYTGQDILGQSLTCLMPARYREAHQKGLERVRASGHSALAGKAVELYGLKKDGTEFPLELSLGTWKSGDTVFFSGIIRDITERKRIEEFHRTQVAVSLVLASSDSFTQAAPRLLQAVCDITGWELGLIWLVDRDTALLRCEALWHQPHVPVTPLKSMQGHPAFACGIGLPGRIWASGEPAWIPDVRQDANFPRAAAAAEAGLHGAFGVPIKSGRRIMGVMEFFSREIRQPDTTLMQMMADIGIKVGQFVERKKDTERLRKINECLLSFGSDAHANINKLTALCGELLGGAWAVYSHVDGNRLYAVGRWRTPADLQPVHPMTGYACADVIQKSRDELVVVRHLPMTSYAETDPSIMAHGLQTYLGQAVRRNGRYIGALCVVFQQDIHPREGDRRLMGILASAIGVEEEREQAQEALQHAYDETEKILASVPGAILVADEQLRVVYANALACQHFGDGRCDIAGAVLGDLLPEEVAQRAWVFTRRTPQTAENGYWQQDREFERQGKTYQYRLFPIAIRGSERPQTGLVIWDITEQKRLGDQLIQAEKLASLGTLVSGMAHEVNNPAQGIMGMAQMMLDETDPEIMKDYARDIVGYTQHIATVVRDFAAYTRRPDRDGVSDINLNDRMAEALKLARRNPAFGHVEVVTNFQAVPALRARRTEIDQVFVNLIINAVHAMDGHGRLTLATARQGDLVTASVGDTGCGIPKDRLGKIFDPFYTTKDPGRGTGLGLYIVHKIVANHKGQIHIDSEVGAGTTFTVAFPLGHTHKEVRHEVPRP